MTATPKKRLTAPVSLADLGRKAQQDPDYRLLLQATVQNLGGKPSDDVSTMMAYLYQNAAEAEQAMDDTDDADELMMDEVRFVMRSLNGWRSAPRRS